MVAPLRLINTHDASGHRFRESRRAFLVAGLTAAQSFWSVTGASIGCTNLRRALQRNRMNMQFEVGNVVDLPGCTAFVPQEAGDAPRRVRSRTGRMLFNVGTNPDPLVDAQSAPQWQQRSTLIIFCAPSVVHPGVAGADPMVIQPKHHHVPPPARRLPRQPGGGLRLDSVTTFSLVEMGMARCRGRDRQAGHGHVFVLTRWSMFAATGAGVAGDLVRRQDAAVAGSTRGFGPSHGGATAGRLSRAH